MNSDRSEVMKDTEEEPLINNRGLKVMPFIMGVVADTINNSIQEAISSSLRIQRYQHLHRTNRVANDVFVEWIWASDHRSKWD
ncbi:hypothetical protein RDI58_024900 [Solanum bulbocastanum]|uniref:Uncharacterized protein n=1 Tax=Solanum bulbocastanum TaxID=147425 RepID=A0AAN8Y3V8_SOLBU